MRWDDARRNRAEREVAKREPPTNERRTHEEKQASARAVRLSSTRVEARHSLRPAPPLKPRVRGPCVRALVAIREPQSSTGAWGKTEVVTFVQLDALGACPVENAAPTDVKQRRDLAAARSLRLKEGGVVALDDATDWALGTDDAGNTWRSRTFTAVVEKAR